ncbi:MAG: ribosome biogenesis GTPase Der [Patescibacteria group bacterium]|nr:ribosome biogenesis GTPase Der [Patescibacteria group bacterium]
MLPIVAIVGKPNTGKSTLFNRLLGKRRAIESKTAGTTRDRIMTKAHLHDNEVYLVDTGGITFEAEDGIEEDTRKQAEIAINGADVIVFVVDGQKVLTSEDFHVADLLRKSGKPTVLVANKLDNLDMMDRKYNLYELGFGDAVAVSALHKTGMDELIDFIEDALDDLGIKKIAAIEDTPEGTIKMGLLGKPNVGKSSILNAIVGSEQAIVSATPGTTRDCVDMNFDHDGRQYVISDTAGIRRPGKLGKATIEKFSVLRSLRAIEDSDVVVLVLDYNEGVTNQDLHVCSEILEQGKGLVLAANKTDLMENKEKNTAWFISRAQKEFDFLPWAPLVFVSAKEGDGLKDLLSVVADAYDERKKQIPEGELNIWLEDAISKHEPKGSMYGQRNEIRGIRQDGIDPPSFVLKTKFPDRLHFSYKRYLENRLREKFGFKGTSVRLKYK